MVLWDTSLGFTFRKAIGFQALGKGRSTIPTQARRTGNEGVDSPKAEIPPGVCSAGNRYCDGLNQPREVFDTEVARVGKDGRLENL